VPLRKSRRLVSANDIVSRGRRAHDGADDSQMGPAPAEVAGERLLDVGFTRVLAGGQEGRGLHDHAVDAVAALHGLLVDEGLLYGMRTLRRAETFQRDDLLRPDRRERHHARAHRLAVEMHRAGTALREAAAEARAVECQIVAESVEQRHLGILDGHGDRSAVDIEGNRGGHDQIGSWSAGG